MSRNNDVFQVLATSGNQAVKATGARVGTLLPGQIGVFDANTNLSIDGTANVRDFYVAVGLDPGATGTTTDVMKSTGTAVQKRNIVHYSYRPHTPGQPMIVELRDYTADCETEYGLKLELRNQEIYRTQGYNQFTKTYSMVTSCCKGCEATCPSGDANEITKILKLQINNDPSGLITAVAIARTAILDATIPALSGDLAEGAVVSDADLEAIMAYNATQTDPADYYYTDLRITTVTQAVNNFSAVNLKYFYPRETVIIPSKIEGFKCNGTLVTTQQAVFEEGNGYDLKQKEYIAQGWRDSPYRLSTLNGVADERTYYINPATKYDQIALTYDQFSIGAWLEYLNNEATIIAIPAADTTTRNALITILDRLTAPSGFDALADDAAAASTNPATVELTTNKTVATDGLA